MILIGLGNPLMTDEGIGVRLISEIESRNTLPEGIEVADMGTAGIGLLHAIAGHDKAIFIDCALMGTPPGSIRRFTPQEVVTKKIQTRFSLHEGDLLNCLRLAKQLGDCPDEVVIFGIEPEAVEPGQALTPTLENQIGHYLGLISTELNKSVLTTAQL